VFTLKEREEKADKESMELTEEQYQEIKGLPPKHRGHVRIDNREVIHKV
jgi:hypothetical protein